MVVVSAGYEILDQINGMEVLRKIERIARVCYKSEDKIADGTAERMVRSLIRNGHESMLEHVSFSVKFIVDRGVSHEIVRHRLASFAQESTRYCNYGHSGEITVIKPCFWSEDSANYMNWYDEMKTAERRYLELIADNASPQEARSVLPNSLKTEIVMTANLREWRHFLRLRAVGTAGKPHPQMREVTIPLLRELQNTIPVVFNDLFNDLIVKQ